MGNDDHAVLRWPFFCVVGLLVIPILVFINDFGPLILFLGIVLMPYVSLPVALLALWATARAAAAAWGAARKKAWKRCLSALVLPIFLVIGLISPRAIWSIWDTSGEWIRLQLEKPGYWAKINELNPDDGPRLVVFPWGGWAGLAERVMVYDESDEIVQEESKRSTAWKKRIERTDLVCRFVAVHMEGHFYKAYLDC